MKNAFATAAVVSSALAAALAGQAFAHHAFMAQYDCNAPAVISGRVTNVEWVNPHTWVYLTVSAPGKPDQDWMVEGGTPNTLIRGGITRERLKAGVQVSLRGFLTKDRVCHPWPATGRATCKAEGRAISFEDGKWLFFGALGTGEPHDPAEPPGRYVGSVWQSDAGGRASYLSPGSPTCRDPKP